MDQTDWFQSNKTQPAMHNNSGAINIQRSLKNSCFPNEREMYGDKKYFFFLVDSNNICERRGLHCRGFEICTRETSQSSRDDALNYVSPTLKCSCPFCPEGGLGGKVCGTDDRTYPSECSLRSAACQTGRLHLKVKQRGACGKRFASCCPCFEIGEVILPPYTMQLVDNRIYVKL